LESLVDACSFISEDLESEFKHLTSPVFGGQEELHISQAVKNMEKVFGQGRIVDPEVFENMKKVEKVIKLLLGVLY
jgi:hypothetical protein